MKSPCRGKGAAYLGGEGYSSTQPSTLSLPLLPSGPHRTQEGAGRQACRLKPYKGTNTYHKTLR